MLGLVIPGYITLGLVRQVSSGKALLGHVMASKVMSV